MLALPIETKLKNSGSSAETETDVGLIMQDPSYSANTLKFSTKVLLICGG